MTYKRGVHHRGVTLIDAMVGIALMLVVFLGIYAAFQLSIDAVTNNKARAGATALANERMEYIRSLPYASEGTVGGVPSGTIPQSETVVFNGITYTRRTVIEYADDPKDGLGASDANSIVEDYRAVKVDVAWTPRSGVTRHITLATRVSPPTGLESSVPGGTLFITVTNAASQPFPGASVSIINAGASPAVSLNTFSNASGTVTVLGAPSAAGYQIIVTSPGYSTAQTYAVTGSNTNPNPGNLTVSNNHTTAATLSIDALGSKTVKTWTQVQNGTWTDAFSNGTKVATSSNISVAAGVASLSSGSTWGELQSIAIAPSYLNTWKTLTITDTKPGGTTLKYRVYDGSGSTLVPDAQLPGNAAGLTGGVIDLSGVSTSTFTSIRLDAVFTAPTTTTPTLDTWTVAYTYGPQPLPNIAFSLQGAKTTGSGPGGTIYKYASTSNSGASGSVVVPSLEWDNYTITIGGATGYDVASACNPQPESLSPGVAAITNLFLAAHTSDSLLVDVRSAGSGGLIPGATVSLTRAGFAATSTADTCGQTFFSGLTASSNYTLTVTAPGYTPYTGTNINVSGTTRQSVTLN